MTCRLEVLKLLFWFELSIQLLVLHKAKGMLIVIRLGRLRGMPAFHIASFGTWEFYTLGNARRGRGREGGPM